MTDQTAFMSETESALFMDEVADTVRPSSDLTCLECGTPLTWKGTGFRPKYCSEHKRYGKRTGRPVGRPRKDGTPSGSGEKAKTAPRNNAAIERAIQTLELMYGMLGTGLTMTVAPTLGREVVNKRADLAESYRMLLETDKRFREWFSEVEGKAAWLPIIVVHGDLVVNTLLGRQVAAAMRAEAAATAAEEFGPDATNNYMAGGPDYHNGAH